MPDLLSWTGETLARGSGSPTACSSCVLLYLVVGFALSQTAWGRHVYAVGDDPEAARLGGIRGTGCCSASTSSPAWSTASAAGS